MPSDVLRLSQHVHGGLLHLVDQGDGRGCVSRHVRSGVLGDFNRWGRHGALRPHADSTTSSPGYRDRAARRPRAGGAAFRRQMMKATRRTSRGAQVAETWSAEFARALRRRGPWRAMAADPRWRSRVGGLRAPLRGSTTRGPAFGAGDRADECCRGSAWAVDVASEISAGEVLDLCCLDGFVALTLADRVGCRVSGGRPERADAIRLARERGRRPPGGIPTGRGGRHWHTTAGAT